MWSFQHEQTTTATREQLWALWSDPANWPKWDATLESVQFDGPFESGAFGRLKPIKAKEIALELLDVEPLHSFVDIQLLPSAKMHTYHRIMGTDDGGLKVLQTGRFTGTLGRVFSFVIGRGLKRDMPVAISELIALAEAS
jgi:hypothetical protein